MKSRADCCAQLAETLEESGIAILQGRASKRTAGALKRLAAAVAERDAKLRGAALNALMAVFQQEGSRLWDLLGEGLPATQVDLVRERSKIVERALAKRGLAPGDVVRPPHRGRPTCVGFFVDGMGRCLAGQGQHRFMNKADPTAFHSTARDV